MDEILFRSLKKGCQFNLLFPTVKCERVSLGNGDTDFSIIKMVDWIELHQDQTLKISPLLEKSSLQDTCKSIHDFLYWHFQYKQDLEDQLLRSPACAWKQRYEGIDCKSYTIVGSSILLNLGINHYIRKVAYQVPGEYTHVYLIVPKNQNNNSLDDGYYMIDGTINTTQEPYYLQEKDEFMSDMKHFGLNQPYLGDPTTGTTGTRSTWDKVKSIDFSQFTKKLKINIHDLIKNLGCLGGTALGTDELNAALAKFTNNASAYIEKLNDSIAKNNVNGINEAVYDFRRMTLHANNAYLAKNNSNHWNPCTTHNLDTLQHYGDVFFYIINPALDAYLDKYFDKTELPKGYVNMPYLEPEGLLDWVWLNGENLEYDIPKYSYTFKNQNVPAFEINQYLVNSLDTGFNPLDFLSSIEQAKNIISFFTPAGSNDPGANSGGTYTADPNNPTPSTSAGFGWLLGGLILIAGLSVASNSNSTSKTTGVRVKKSPIKSIKKTTKK